MQHKQGENRDQMFMFSLESAIPADAFVRVVDAFVDAIDLKSFGFAHVECHEEGPPPYPPSVLMKLYLYGYRYGIRTTRKLEREAQTNFEAMWLLSGLCPKYKTIADFRKNHAKAFRAVFRRFVCLLKEWKLIDGQTVAIDSFKIRGSNSLKNNFNEKKLRQHLAYIDEQINAYEKILDSCDLEEDKKELEARIEERKEKQEKYTRIQKKLEASDYDRKSDSYSCPMGNTLHTNGQWHIHITPHGEGKGSYRFKRYTTSACKFCENRHKCTQSKQNGRAIDRSEYADIIETNAKRVNENPDYYRLRQQITEHQFGTLKRQRGYTNTNLRGKEKVLGEIGLLFIAYNLTRCISILGVSQLIKALRECCLLFLKTNYKLILNVFNEAIFPGKKVALY